MPDFVRVRLENGAHASISAAFAASLGLPALDAPALTPDGRVAPTVVRRPLGDAPPQKPRGSTGRRGRSRPTPTEAVGASEPKEG